jgi:DNA-binding response OmpR family regulator
MNKKVLLCDDEVHILRTAEIKVRQAGLDVRTARDGQEAWELILKETPDIVVTDLQMPRVDGLELVSRIRAHEATRHLPVIMLTAKGFEVSRTELATQWGIFKVMAKPFSPRELVRVLDEALGAAQASG